MHFGTATGAPSSAYLVAWRFPFPLFEGVQDSLKTHNLVRPHPKKGPLLVCSRVIGSGYFKKSTVDQPISRPGKKPAPGANKIKKYQSKVNEQISGNMKNTCQVSY